MTMKPKQPTVSQESKSAFTTPLRTMLATTTALWMGGLQAQAPSLLAARSASEGKRIFKRHRTPQERA